MNKQEALKKIEELKKFVSDCEDEEYDPCWRAELNGEYWTISEYGDLKNPTEDGDELDDYRYRTGNYFRTIEVADDVGLRNVDKQEAIMRVKRYIFTEFGEFVPDWKKPHEVKDSVDFCYKKDKFTVRQEYDFKEYSPIGYLVENNAYKVIEACEDDLRIIFDVTE